jgi:hypothetical protein
MQLFSACIMRKRPKRRYKLWPQEMGNEYRVAKRNVLTNYVKQEDRA